MMGGCGESIFPNSDIPANKKYVKSIKRKSLRKSLFVILYLVTLRKQGTCDSKNKKVGLIAALKKCYLNN